jgi:outer membrane receptor protein involved in Fe transport
MFEPALPVRFLLLAALFATTPVSAQDQEEREDSANLEDLVITAQFREQTPIEVPIAVTAYSQSFLDDVGANQLDAVSAFVPGLLVQEQSVNNPGFVIRGITSDDGASNIEPRVSVFQNGVSISRSRGSYVELFDLERLEVLKGPQGTLFGRSAQIGAVHVITHKPVYRLESSGRVTLGNFGQREIEAMINAPLSTDTVALRVAAIHRERDGYLDNNTGGDLNGTDTRAIRASLRWDITPVARLDLIGHYAENEPPGTSFKSGVIPALGGDTDPNNFASLNTFGGLLGGRDLGVERDISDLTAILDWQLNSDWNLVSTTAWRQFDSFETFDPDGSAFDLFLFGEDAEADQFSSELRLSWQGDRGVTGFFGAGIFQEEGSQRVPLGLDAAYAGALFDSLGAQGPIEDGRAPLLGSPALAAGFLSGDPAVLEAILAQAGIPTGLYQQEQFTNFADNSSIDVFADFTWQATDRLALTAGARYTWDEKETLASAGVELDNPFVGNLLVPDLAGRVSSAADPDIDDRFDGASWRFVADYAWTEDVHTYFNYARGRRPEVIEDLIGEFDPAIGQPVDFEVVPAETVDSFEVGFKGLFWDNRAQFDVAAFYYDYENFQTTVAAEAGPGQPPELVLVNAGTADSTGLETQLLLRATDRLSLYASYAYNRSRFDETDERGNPQLFAGNRFRLSPDHSGALSLRYTHPTDFGTIYVAPSYTAQSSVFFEDDNQGAYTVFDPGTGQSLFEVPAVRQDSYGLLNLRAGVSMMNERLSIEAYARNLLDEEYIIDGGNTGGSFGIPTFIAGPPRFYGLSLTLVY